MSQEWFASWFDSPYYPILYQHRDDEEASSFLGRLINHFQPDPGATFLDLACGRGRHALFLNQQGFQVTGLDLSPESISDASKNASPTLKFRVHDMRDPFGDSEYDYILNLFTSFGYFSDLSQNELVLQNIRQALKPDGTFVLDFMNTTKVLEQLVPEEEKLIEGIRFKISRWLENGIIHKQIKIYDNKKHFLFTEKVQALSLSDFSHLIANTGLNIKEKWGDYAGNPYSPATSPRLILFCSH